MSPDAVAIATATNDCGLCKEQTAMSMRRFRAAALTMMLGFGSLIFQSCPLTGLLDDCFGEDTISSSEYDDLNAVERLLYEENWCGRYTRRSDFFGDLFD